MRDRNRRSRVGWLALGALLSGITTSLADAPEIERFEPRTVPSGTATRITLKGNNLRNIESVWTSTLGETDIDHADKNDDGEAEILVPASAFATSGPIALRVVSAAGASNPIILFVDDLRTAAAKATDSSENARYIDLDSAVKGTTRDEARNYYRIKAKIGTTFHVEAIANRIGSQLDPVVRILSPDGHELAYMNDSPGIGPDCRIEFTPDRDGDLLIELRDAEYEGGRGSFYRLRLTSHPQSTEMPTVSEQEPNDERISATPLSTDVPFRGTFGSPADVDWYVCDLEPDSEWLFSVEGHKSGGPCIPMITAFDAEGSQLAEGSLQTLGSTVFLKPTASGLHYLRIQDLAGQPGTTPIYTITATKSPARFAIESESDTLQIKKGESAEIKVTIDRTGYSGPIELSAKPERLLAIENPIIDAKTKEWSLKVRAEDEASLGTRPFRFFAKRKDAPADAEIVPVTTRAAWKNHFNRVLMPNFDTENLHWITISARGENSAE